MPLIMLVAALTLPISPATAQDLEPRAFSPAPVGLNIVAVGYTNSRGNVFFDQALVIEDATGTVHSAAGLYVRTFGIAGMSAKAAVAVPFAWGDWEGLVDGVPASTSRRGFADPRVALAVNFFGAPAVTLKEFAAYQEGIIGGASLAASVPLGQYDPEKLINLGSNRWALRARAGLSGRIRRWTVEAMVDGHFYTTNDEYFGGAVVEQAPIVAIQGDVIYTFRSGLWAGVSAGLADGGRITVNGVEKEDVQRNSRLGFFLTMPFTRRHSVALYYTNSVRTRLGTDFDLFNFSYQYRWGGGI
jgi:hypothetical protein